MVDPLSYSTTRVGNQSFDILADHPGLMAATLALMRTGGMVFFSTNHHGFELHCESLHISGIEEITDATIPEDYIRNRQPVHRCWRITV